MLSFVLFATLIGMLSFVSSLKLKLKISLCAPFCVMLTIIAEYILTVICGSVTFSVYTLCVVILVGVFIVLLKNRTLILNHFKLYCLNSTIAIVILLMFASVIMFLHGEQFGYFDEFHHGGLMCNDLFNNDYFYFTEGSFTLYHNDYPPILPLLETFGCFITQCYSISNLFLSLWFFMLLLFFPIIPERINFAEKTKFALKQNLITAFLYAILIISATFLCSYAVEDGRSAFGFVLYADTPLGLIAGLGFYIAVKKNHTSTELFAEAIILIFLSMIKQMAIFFAFCIFIVCLINIIINKTTKSKKIKKWILLFVLTFILAFVLQITGKILYGNSGAYENCLSAQFTFSIESFIENISDLFSDNFTSKYSPILQQFFETLINSKAFLPLHLPLILIIIVSLAIMFALLIFLRHKKNNNYNYVIALFAPLIILFLYLFILLYAYLFYDFNMTVDLRTVSLSRYLLTFNAMINIVCIYLFSTLIPINLKGIIKNCLAFVLIFLLLLVASPTSYISAIQIQNNDNRYIIGTIYPPYAESNKQYQDEDQKINGTKNKLFEQFPQGTKFLGQSSLGSCPKLNYCVMPMQTNFYACKIIKDYIDTGNTNIIRNYSFLYVVDIRESDVEIYEKAFSFTPEINTLYKININDDNVQLEKIGTEVLF